MILPPSVFPVWTQDDFFHVLKYRCLNYWPNHSGETWPGPGNTKGGSITVLLTSCLPSLNYSVLQIKTKIVSCRTTDSKPFKQQVNSTGMLPPLVFPAWTQDDFFHVLKYWCLNYWPNHSGETWPGPRNTKGGSITVPLTSCLTGLDESVLQI